VNLEFEQSSRKLMQDLGLCAADEVKSVEKLTGGVASDIGKVSFANRSVCVKFALAKLRVEEEWFAPVHRGKAEYAWLQMAGTLVPNAVPMLFGWSDSCNGFAMEFLEGIDTYLWKNALMKSAPDRGEAAAVGNTLGRIHAASTSGFDTAPFDNADDFESLRIDPYLRFTATRHPNLAETLTSLADALYASNLVVIHGDVSPKNILIRSDQPVILDAECATMGDPSFDLAFCMNHLVLKSIHFPKARRSLLGSIAALWAAYAPHISWESAAKLEARIVALLPALMLARVDGKSPVEYLCAAERDHVRAVSTPLIRQPVFTIDNFLGELEQGSIL